MRPSEEGEEPPSLLQAPVKVQEATVLTGADGVPHDLRSELGHDAGERRRARAGQSNLVILTSQERRKLQEPEWLSALEVLDDEEYPQANAPRSVWLPRQQVEPSAANQVTSGTIRPTDGSSPAWRSHEGPFDAGFGAPSRPGMAPARIPLDSQPPT